MLEYSASSGAASLGESVMKRFGFGVDVEITPKGDKLDAITRTIITGIEGDKVSVKHLPIAKTDGKQT
eukprot:4535648-Pyramimonas_sp.AAC.1